jgi:hypothetical protein
MQSDSTRFVSAVLVWLALAAPAAAQVAINQAKAKAGLGGCDAPGFPVTICKPGPYKLTGPLTPTARDQTLIEIATNVVTIDLGGHYVGGNCSLGSTTGNGISTVDRSTQVAIFNGVVSCMGGHGIFLSGDNHRVERVAALFNGWNGIGLGPNSIVADNQANNNAATGITCFGGCVIRGNTANYNTGGITLTEGLVTNNIAWGNSTYGLIGGDFGYSHNVLNNNGWGAVYATAGVTSMGGNVCSSVPC